MSYENLHKAIVDRLLEGEGTASSSQRHGAFDNSNLKEPLKGLIEKVALNSYKISDLDMDAVIKSGLSEDQVFELVICAAVGQATRQYDNALKALNEAVGD